MGAGTVGALGGEVAAEGSGMLTHAVRVLLVGAQVALIAVVLRVLELEGQESSRLMLLAAAGFVVNAALPLRWRLPWFTFLSIAGIMVMIGTAAFWVLGLGCGLILIARLPVSFGLRALLLLAAGAALAAARVGWWLPQIPPSVWPVLGAMFMFRLALYLQALREGVPADGWQTAAYFFLLPAPAYPLFPVVDYQQFVRKYFDSDAVVIYQRGMRWIVRGVIQLLLYRLVYRHLVLDPSEVKDLATLAQASVGFFLLYLRVSGQFHLIIGVLHLFGFRLPETHHLYYFSSSFTDLWRRINIYWKDFITKVVYFPSFFRLRKLGDRRAMVLATVASMSATWALHGWQWFWLLGSNPFTVVDSVFWAILGVAVVITTARDLSAPRARPDNARWRLSRGLRIAIMFTTMCVLWTMWSSDSTGAFLHMVAQGRHATPLQVAAVLTAFAAFTVLAGFRAPAPGSEERAAAALPLRRDLTAGGATLLCLGLLLLGSRPAIQVRLGPTAQRFLTSLGSSRFNQRDQALLTRGYYEELNAAGRNPSAMLGMQGKQEVAEPYFEGTPAIRWRPDFQVYDIVPGVHTVLRGAPFDANSRGFRDREYAIPKPPVTIRIALLGPSSVNGIGVPKEQVVDELLEERLNRELGGPNRHFEVLNASVSGYSLLQEVALLESGRIEEYQPDVVIITSHPPDLEPLTWHLRKVLVRSLPLTDPQLVALFDQADLGRKPDHPSVNRVLAPALKSIVDSAISRAAIAARRINARPALLMLRLPEDHPDTAHFTARAGAANGMPVFDLTEIYPPGLEKSYAMAGNDRHFNAEGHRLVADQLFEALKQHPELLQPVPPVVAASAGH